MRRLVNTRGTALLEAIAGFFLIALSTYFCGTITLLGYSNLVMRHLNEISVIEALETQMPQKAAQRYKKLGRTLVPFSSLKTWRIEVRQSQDMFREAQGEVQWQHTVFKKNLNFKTKIQLKEKDLTALRSSPSFF